MTLARVELTMTGREAEDVAREHRELDGEAFGEWTLRQVDRLLDERDPMITKAVSWVLRQMVKHQPAAVQAYLESRSDRMAALPRRESLTS